MKSRYHWFPIVGLTALLLLSGCKSSPFSKKETTDQRSETTSKADAEANDSGKEEPSLQDKPFAKVNPNVVIGRITWVSDNRSFVVIQLDNAYPVDGRILVSTTPTLQPLAILRTVGGLQGRSIGAHVLDGTAAPGQDVQLPGREFAFRLQERYGEDS